MMNPRQYLKISMLVLLPLLVLLVMIEPARSEECHTDTECGCIEECL